MDAQQLIHRRVLPFVVLEAGDGRLEARHAALVLLQELLLVRALPLLLALLAELLVEMALHLLHVALAHLGDGAGLVAGAFAGHGVVRVWRLQTRLIDCGKKNRNFKVFEKIFVFFSEFQLGNFELTKHFLKINVSKHRLSVSERFEKR